MPTVVATLALLYAVENRLGEPEISALDLNRFPGRAEAWSKWEWTNRHQIWLWKVQRFSDRLTTREDLDRWQAEHTHCRAAWAELADAWGEKDPPWEERRKHLWYLRRVLGREAYWQGRMPPLCPWWRFEEH